MRPVRQAFGAALLVLTAVTATHADVSGSWAFGEFYIAGVLKEQVGIGLHRQGETNPAPGEEQQGDIPGFHYAYTWLDLESEWTLGESFQIQLNPFIIGDLAYPVYRGKRDWAVFAPSDGKLAVDDSPLRILREAYLQYTTRWFQIRAGQQTVGWGESDGLRLLDVVNPLDSTRQAIIFDEGFRLTRIPLTMLRTIVTPPPLVVGGRRIFSSWSLEAIVTPQLEPARVYLSPDGRYGGHGASAAGGIWAAPPVDWKDRTEELNLPFGTFDGFLPDDAIRAHDRQPHYQWDDPLPAFRVSGQFRGGRVTINYAQRIGGLFDLPVPKIRSIVVTSLVPEMRPGFDNPVVEAELDVDLVYPRRHILGGSLNYDLGDFLTLPTALGGASPVVRIEMAYTLGFPFNSKQRVKETISLEDAEGFPDVTPAAYPGFFQKHDLLQYMVGFDLPLRVDLLNPAAQFLTSFQVFHFRPIGADETLALQPYKRFLFREDQFFLSFLANTPYLYRKIIPQILVAYDVNALGWFTKSKIMHEFGNHWRVEWGIVYFNRGRLAPTESVFGLWDRRSDVFLQVGYQF